MIKIYRTFILLPLAALILLAAIVGCSAEDDQTTLPTEGKKVQVNLNLSVPKMVETGDISGSTRALTGLTLEEESAVRTLSYFEFNGTTDASRCVSKGVATMGSSNYITGITLTSSTSMATVYVVANLGDVTASITANATTGTTLADFKTKTFDYLTDTGRETSGLPMIGSTSMIPSTGSGSIVLTRMVAKIKFSCNLQIPSGDSFAISSLQIKNVPNKGIYLQTAGSPDPTSVNFTGTTYSSNQGTSATWYIPANMRGVNSAISLPTAKSDANALPYSTYVELTGVYTYSFGQSREVTYHFYLGENETSDFNISPNKAYNVSVTINGIDTSDGRISIVNDLSLNAFGTRETANSYIVRDGGQAYKFYAKIMGNGKTTPTSTVAGGNPVVTQNAPAITPVSITPANAIVLWETGSKGSVIQDGSVTLGVDGYVKFITANNTTNGNAVIAVRDASNNILWSWHIWKVPYNPNSDYDTYTTFAGRSFKMMKYNLGATAISPWSGAATNAGDLGLFYQWGRKDPFVGVSGWTTTFQPVTYASTYSRGAVAKSAATVSGKTGADATIAYGILNPTTFITAGTSVTDDDWLNVTGYANQRDNLWGNPNKTSTIPNPEIGAKSIYDPCPPGWRVPPPDAFTLFTTIGIGTLDKQLFNVTDISTYDSSRGYSFYYKIPRSGSSSYYPSLRSLATNTGNMTIDSNGSYWTSSSSSSGNPASIILHFNPAYVGPIDSRGRVNGFSLRCAQE